MGRPIFTGKEMFSHYPYLEFLQNAASRVPPNGKIVELGCHYGKATSVMASGLTKGQTIVAIDHFSGTDSEREDFARIDGVVEETFGVTPRELFDQNAAKHDGKITLLEKNFDDAVNDFPDKSIDMIFFDGDHMQTYHDLRLWWPKLKDGGIAYGHDINQKKFTVKQDVERFCAEEGLSYTVPMHELFVIRKERSGLPRAYVITMGHNTRKWAKACVLSVADCLPHYANITHVIVDDWSTDGTWERYQQEDVKLPHQILVRPPERTGSPLASFMFGLSQVVPSEEDVIFWLDGDDWLCDPKAIKYMMDVYVRNPVTEMAYSQHIVFRGRDVVPTDGISRPIDEPAMVRPDNVRFSHFRSFKFKMLKHVRPEYLRQRDGKYWETCGDSALYLPMLEVARKVAFVNKPLYVYNQATGANEWETHPVAAKNSTRIRSMEPNLNNREDLQKGTRFPPVRRFKLDFGRACDIECQGCYYKHQKEQFHLTFEQIQAALQAGRERGNRACDFSGGEPTLYKDLPRWLAEAERTGIAPGIITHGQRLAKLLPTLWDAGLHDVLLSVHGGESAHNWWTQTKDGYAKVWKSIDRMAGASFKYRTNTVLHAGYKTLPAMAVDLSRASPYISNFINFNPYYEWADAERPFQARISDIAPYLKEAIDILTNSGTMVNVRYFPFCALKGYEKHIVDMPQVMFDPYEWDYGVMPKTIERYAKYGVELADKTREYSTKCAECAMRETVCYGINGVYLREFGDGELEPYSGERVLDRFHFRKQAEPGQLYTFIGHNYEWRFKRSA